MKNLLPARSTVEDIGIAIKPNLLERSKIKNHKLSIGDSIYIGEGDYTTKTKQIVLSGIADKMKYSINWKLQRAN